MNIVELSSVSKYFPIADTPFFTPALIEIDLAVKPNQIIAIIGPSGSGKSTILNLIAGLIRPSTGSVKLNGKELRKMTFESIQHLRRGFIGYLKQNPWENLVRGLTVLENIELSVELKGVIISEERIAEILTDLDIKDLRDTLVDHLSGGELLRIGIAIVIVLNPELIILDEPTRDLDNHTAEKIIQNIYDLCKSRNITMIMATHDPMVEKYVDGSYRILDGRIAGFRQSVGSTKSISWDEYAVISGSGTVKLPDKILNKHNKTGLVKFVYDGDQDRYYLKIRENFV